MDGFYIGRIDIRLVIVPLTIGFVILYLMILFNRLKYHKFNVFKLFQSLHFFDLFSVIVIALIGCFYYLIYGEVKIDENVLYPVTGGVLLLSFVIMTLALNTSVDFYERDEKMKPKRSVKARILVNDYKKMYDFYKDVMEYEVHWGNRNGTYASFKVPGEESPDFAIYVKEDYRYYEGYKDIGNQNKSDYVVLCIECDDVDKQYKYLKKKGVEFIGEPRDIPHWYYRVVLFRDPEGNLIDLGGPLKDKKKRGA